MAAIEEEQIEFLDDKNFSKENDKSIEERLSLEIPEYETGNSDLKEDNGKIFKCQKCGETFKTKKEMILHKIEKHGNKVYDCEICSFQTTQRYYLKIHQSSVHEGKLYYCKQCNYQAKCSLSLRNHKKAIHDGVLYSCEKCTYKFLYHKITVESLGEFKTPATYPI